MSGAGFYLLVEQDEAQERPGHGPLVSTVLEDDDVQHRGQHLRDSDAVKQRNANVGAASEPISDLLDHLRVLLHDVEEAIIRCHGSGPLFRGTR